jgi:hypothetical protein
MSLATLLSRQEAAVLDVQIAHLSGVQFLTEKEITELAAKCKVSPQLEC